MVRSISDRRGIGRLGCLIWIILGATAAYVGNSLGKPWFAYQQYRDELKSAADFAEVLSDSTIRVRVMARADSLKLPIEARTVNITRDANKITISSKYEVTVVLKLYGPVVFKFHPSVQGPL